MSSFPHAGELYRNHILPFEALAGEDVSFGSGGDVLRIRYDGHTRGGENRIYAVIPITDLDIIARDIKLPQPPGIGLPGSDLFFMKTPDGISVYIDTDRREDVFMEILDVAHDMGYRQAERGLDFFHVPDTGYVVTPKQAAFDANRFENVPVEIGYKMIRQHVAAALTLEPPVSRKGQQNDPGYTAS